MPVCRRRFTTKSDVTLRLRTLVNTILIFTIRLRLRLSLRLRTLVNMGTDTLRNTTHYIWTFQKSTFQQFIDSQSTVVLYALNHQCRVQFLLLYSEQNLCFRQMKFQHRYQQSTFLFNLIYWNNFSHNVTQKITCPVRQVLAIFTCPWNFFHWFRTSVNVEPGKQIDARH